jgi:hypothetical protein
MSLLPTGYINSIASFAAAASPTDVVILKGVAGVVFELISWKIAYTASSGATNFYADLVRRSAAATGGTSATVTGYPLDTSQVTPALVMTRYTASPTVGTAVGILYTGRVLADVTPGMQDFYTAPGIPPEGIRIRGASDYITLNLGGVTVPGSSPLLRMNIQWRVL